MPRLPEPPIPAETLLLAYRSGIFPMADSRNDPEVFWVEPRDRAIIPLDGFRCSTSLKKVLRQDRFTVTIDRAFERVMSECARPRAAGSANANAGSWISHRIQDSYIGLHRTGHAHSVECWREGNLAGGLYGVSFGQVFCGESMFSRADNASKAALAALVACMKRAQFRLLDCQFMTDHLASLGAREIPQTDYLALLEESLRPAGATIPQAYASLLSEAEAVSSSPGKLIAQSFTQTS